jgi:UDP-N-acetylglucosamine diphosphorylase/glucosamine-1-phosphate N-acetyltransferase
MIAIILAAGQGTRMRSGQAKVLHRVAGMPLVEHVARACDAAGIERKIVVIGHGREAVRAALADMQVEFVVQEPQLGTGHAVLMAQPLLGGVRGDAFVLCGDAPLVRPETLRAMGTAHAGGGYAATVLTAVFEDPSGYGRIVRGTDGSLLRIVEQRDAGPAELAIREVNSGAYCFSLPELFEALAEVTPDNAQKEIYLTDVIALFRSRGLRVGVWCVPEADEVSGVNTVEDLARADALFLRRRCEHCRRALEGDEAGLILKRGRHAYLAVAREPYNSGHCVVVPYRHVTGLEEAGSETVTEILALAAAAEEALARAYKPEGFNQGTNVGAVDGSSPGAHLVWHVMPRWCGDTNFMSAVGGTKVLPESPSRTHGRLRDALAG